MPRRSSKRLWLALAALPVVWVLALLAAAQWLERHPQQVAAWIGDWLDRPIVIGAVRPRLDWHHLRLAVDDVTVLDHAGERVALRFDRLGLTLAPERLWSGQWLADRVEIRGVTLRVRRSRSGTIEIAGFETGAAAGNGEDWFGRMAIAVSDGEIELTDDIRCPGCEPLRLHQVALTLNGDADDYRIQGSLQLAEHGERAQLQAQLSGDPRIAGWGGEIQLHLDDLDARRWSRDRALAGARVQAGRFDVALTSRWRNGRLRDAEGQVEVRDLALQADGAAADEAAAVWALPALSAEFKLLREPLAWRLQGRDLRIVGPQGPWPGGDFELTAQLDDAQALQTLTGSAPGAPVAAVAQLLALIAVDDAAPDRWATGLHGLRPSGRLGRTDWRVQWLPDGAERWSATSHWYDGAVQAWGDVPGVAGITAAVALDHDRLSIQLRDGPGMVIDAPKLLRQPVKLDSGAGVMTARRTPDGVVIEGRDLALVNADAEVRGDVTVNMPHAGRTEVQAAVSVARMDGARVAHYLPVGLIPEASMPWLDQAFRGGAITAGRFEFSGDPAALPFERAEQGYLRGRLTVTGGRLKLAPAWPEITEIDATVVFDNVGLAVRDARGVLLGARVTDVAVAIADLNNTRIQVTGKALGSLRQLRRWVEDSPLRDRFSGLRDIRLAGDGELAIALDMPLDVRKAQFKVQLDLLSADMLIPAVGLHVSRIRGPVLMTPAGIAAQRLEARYAGAPVRFGLDYTERSGMQVTARASLGVAQLLGPWAERLPPAWLALAPGSAVWRLDVNSPPRSGGRGPRRLDLTLSSPLRGLTLALPAPLGKTTQAAGDLTVRTQLVGAALGDVQVQYGDRADAWLYGVAQADTLGGVLRIGARPAPLPRPAADARPPGFAVQISADELVLADWLALGRRFIAMDALASDGAALSDASKPRAPAAPSELPQAASVLREAISHNLARSLLEGRAQAALQDQLNQQAVAAAPAALTLPTPLLRELRLRAAVLHAFGQRLTGMQLRVWRESTPDGSAWRLRARADQLSGSVRWPMARDGEPPGVVQARFEHLTLADHGDRSGPASVDPARLPPVTLAVERLRFGARSLGRLDLETRPMNGGMAVRRLDLSGGSFRVKAVGEWRLATAADAPSAAHRSQFEIDMTSSDFGRTLADFGFTDGLRAADLRADITARWQGPPFAFALDILEGAMALEVGKGSVLQVDPGAGRMFGLLSFSALPRRLSGDFADVSDQGFAFDAITGDFDLRRGVARTLNLVMEGPAARVEIAGEVNLREQTYDQDMVIVPRVSNTLPVAGVVAGGLGLGAALLLVQQLLGEPLNQIVRQRFRVTGPWADPVVTPVLPPPSPSDADDFGPELRDP